jgi:hypothetical protein
MMPLSSQGISVAPRQAVLDVEVQQAVMIGHCPGNVNLQPLLDSEVLLNQLSLYAFAKQWQKLQFDYEQLGIDLGQNNEGLKQRLFNLPIPIDSLQMFQAIFPQAHQKMRYSTQQELAWLPLGVEDFFAYQGVASKGEDQRSDSDQRSAYVGNFQNQKKLLWIVVVDPQIAHKGFLTNIDDDPLDLNNQGSYSALANALQITAASMLMMPDLERLQLINIKPSVPRMRLANIKPQFLPCRFDYQDSHRERRQSQEMIETVKPLPFEQILANILTVLSKQRPDLHFVFSLPYTTPKELEGSTAFDNSASHNTQLSQQTLSAIELLRHSELQRNLHQLQLVYPYLIDNDATLRSASPLIIRQMLDSTERFGAWQSIASQLLTDQYQRFPQQIDQSTCKAAKDHGIALLNLNKGNISLDEERLASIANYQKNDFTRSGEISRFMGWLRRQLEQLALNFIFTFDAQDPRPLLTLTQFFKQLFNAGALQGDKPEDAFSVIQLSSDQQLIFEIALQPVFAIQRIKLHIVNGKLEGVLEVLNA